MYQTHKRNVSPSMPPVAPPARAGKRVEYGQKATFIDHVFTGLLYLTFIAGACVLVILALKVFQSDPRYPQNKEYERLPVTRAYPGLTASRPG